MPSDIPPPDNRGQILEYIFLLSDYKDMLPNFQQTVAILVSLMGPLDEPFLWNAGKQRIFETLFRAPH